MSQFATIEEADAARDAALDRLTSAVETAIAVEKDAILTAVKKSIDGIGNDIAAGTVPLDTQQLLAANTSIEKAKSDAESDVSRLDSLTATLVAGIKDLLPAPVIAPPAPTPPAPTPPTATPAPVAPTSDASATPVVSTPIATATPVIVTPTPDAQTGTAPIAAAPATPDSPTPAPTVPAPASQ